MNAAACADATMRNIPVIAFLLSLFACVESPVDDLGIISEQLSLSVAPSTGGWTSTVVHGGGAVEAAKELGLDKPNPNPGIGEEDYNFDVYGDPGETCSGVEKYTLIKHTRTIPENCTETAAIYMEVSCKMELVSPPVPAVKLARYTGVVRATLKRTGNCP